MQQHYEYEPEQQQQRQYSKGYAQSSENLQQYEQQRSRQQDYVQPPFDQGPHMQQQYIPYPPYTMTHGMYETGSDGKILAAVSYLGLWLTGLLLLLFVRENRFIRFHAMQSLLFFGFVNVMYVVLITIIAHHFPFVFGFAIFAFVLMNIIAGVAWFVGLIGAVSGKCVKLPIVGTIAERYADGYAMVK